MKLVHVVSIALFSTACASAEAPATVDVLNPSVDTASKGDDDRASVFKPTAKPFGQSYSVWAAQFFRYLLAQNASTSPVTSNTSGAVDIAPGQSGKVWFVASPLGGTYTHDVKVPAGKAVMVSPVSYLNDFPCPDPAFVPAPGETLEHFLAVGAQDAISSAANITVDVDGVALRNVTSYRLTTGIFKFTGDVSWQAFDSCITAQSQDAVTSGLFIMTKPLEEGVHTIRLRSTGAWGTSDVTYRITATDH
jgi:hypothetical protein